MKNCVTSKRPVKLHILQFGSTIISVTDLKCPDFNEETFFDGNEHAIFAASSKVVFSHELLDNWLFYVAMLGKTFRKCFEAALLFSSSQSAQYARWGDLR